MSRFRNTKTGVVVSVDDSKDGRFSAGFEPAETPPVKKPVAKKAAVRKSE